MKGYSVLKLYDDNYVVLRFSPKTLDIVSRFYSSRGLYNYVRNNIDEYVFNPESNKDISDIVNRAKNGQPHRPNKRGRKG